jgi:hypothetical protein
VDLSLPVTRLARRRGILPLQAALGRPARLLKGIRERALELQDLGPVREAPTGEGDEVGLARAPRREGGRPFPRTAHLVGIVARQDHAAVDDPGDDRGQLARGHGNHRFVEQPQPLVEAPELDQDLALLMGGKSEQVGIAEALPDRGSVAGGGGSRLPVAACLLLECGRKQKVAALDSVAAVALEQPPGAPQPAARAADLPVAREGHTDPECAAEGGELLARVQVSAMRALERVAVLGFAAEHVRGGGEQLEVLGSERIRPIRGRERLMCFRPGLRRRCLTTPLELGPGIHQARLSLGLARLSLSTARRYSSSAS